MEQHENANHTQDMTYLRICQWVQENVGPSESHSLFLPTFSLDSFIRQGMAEISFLNGNPHSPEFKDMSGLKYLIKCKLANPWNSEGFFRG